MSDYHHFKGDNLTRSEFIQRLVTRIIMDSKVPDEKRENSKVWELKHHASSVQIGRILAEKRGLCPELAEIICVLHDIYAIEHGKYHDHAALSAARAKDILTETEDFTEEEIEIVREAIFAHSDKHIYTDNPYVELAKDADVFDCSLYQGSQGFYKMHKPENVYNEYVSRIKKIRLELGLRDEPVFRD
ncbi:HD domain-containing protein [Patescibacteria group bacterium]